MFLVFDHFFVKKRMTVNHDVTGSEVSATAAVGASASPEVSTGHPHFVCEPKRDNPKLLLVGNGFGFLLGYCI